MRTVPGLDDHLYIQPAPCPVSAKAEAHLHAYVYRQDARARGQDEFLSVTHINIYAI